MTNETRPQQWNGDQHCQVCGNKLGWDHGISTCGHVQYSPSWEEQANWILSDLARCEPGDTLSAGLVGRARALVKTVTASEWARKAH
jgi:hypothetical protein